MIYQNYKSCSFRVCRGLSQGSVLVPAFSSSMVSQLRLYLLATAALSMLTILPFGSRCLRFLLLWRLHKELYFEWSAGVFPTIRENMRRSSFWVVHVFLLICHLRFNPTQTFLGATFNRTLLFSVHVSSFKAQFFPTLKALRCISTSSWGPLKKSLCSTKLFFGTFSHVLHPDGFYFSALPMLLCWNAFIERSVAPSPAASRLPLFHFSSQVLPFLYKSPRLILLCHLLSGPLRLSAFFPISVLA